jgi:probable rRNA maturation factor
VLDLIVLENNTKHQLNIDFLSAILEDVAGKREIELIITDNSEIHEINLTTRGIDKPTDVLSFPYEDMPNVPLGSIVISTDFVEQYSKQYNHSFDDEMALLFIHGLLHLVGYDHEVDNGEHREKEEELIKKYHLPKSLIIRNS